MPLPYQKEIMAKDTPAAPRIQKREKWIDLPAEYAGFKIKVWVNAPSKLWTDIVSQEEAAAQEAATRLVMEHNGWLDFDGEPYPDASDPQFWVEIPTELGACILAAARAEIQKLPNSLAPKRRR